MRAHKLLLLLALSLFAVPAAAQTTTPIAPSDILSAYNQLLNTINAKTAGVVTAPNATPGVVNFDPANLPYARKAMANVRAGLGRAKIAFVGDSTVAGLGAGSGGTTNVNSARQSSFPTQVSKILNSSGLVANSESVFGDGNLTSLYDSRLVYGAGWGSSGLQTAGGQLISNGTTANPLTFSPIATVNQCDVYYVSQAASPTFTLDFDGGAASTITPVNSGSMSKATISTTAGTHVLHIIRTGASGTDYISAIDCYNTAAVSASVWNMGYSGSQSSTWATTGPQWAPPTALALYAPDLTFIDLGINDESTNVTLSTFLSNMQVIITAAKLSGDVVLVMHHPAQFHDTSHLVTMTALQQLAATNNIPIVDFDHRLVSWTQANSLGEMYDAVHCTALGYSDEARAIASVLLQF